MQIKIQSLAYLLFAGLIGFTSCSTDEETPVPTIVINTNSLGSDQTGGSASTGTTVTVNLTATAQEEIAKLSATKTVGGTETTLPTYPVTSGFTSKTSHTWNATYTVVETSGTVALKFSVEDKKGKISTKTFTVTVGSDISTWTGKLLAAPLANGTSKTFFTTSIGGTHTLSEAKSSASLVDFGYFHGATGLATLAAPSDYLTTAYDLTDWSVRNATEFRRTTMTAAEFTAASSSTLIGTTFDGGTVSTDGSNPAGGFTRVNTLSVDQVVAFKTAAGKKGLLHVSAISAGATGSITFTVKVQK